MSIGPLPKMMPKTIGALKVHGLIDGVSPARTAEEMLLGAPEGLVENNRDWLVPDYLDPHSDRLILAYQSFVIQAPDANILVDCAIGEDGEYQSRPDWHHAKSDWLNDLGQAGLAPKDIDMVFLTHLHVDHTGWLTRRTTEGWVPTFPKARHLVTEKEREFWIERHQEFAFMEQSIPDSVKPVDNAGLFEFMQPGDEVAKNMFVVDLAGHTPGMVGLEYREGGKVLAAFNADLMHHPLQMAVPEMSTRFCTDPEQAAVVRREKLSEYASDGTVMFCGHFPGESAGKVAIKGNGFQFVPISEEG